MPHNSNGAGTVDSCYMEFTRDRNFGYLRSSDGGYVVFTPTMNYSGTRPVLLTKRLSVIYRGTPSYAGSVRGRKVSLTISNSGVSTINAALKTSSKVTITVVLTLLSSSGGEPPMRTIFAASRRANVSNTGGVSASDLRKGVVVGLSSRSRKMFAMDYTNKGEAHYVLPVGERRCSNRALGVAISNLGNNRSNTRVRHNETGTSVLLNEVLGCILPVYRTEVVDISNKLGSGTVPAGTRTVIGAGGPRRLGGTIYRVDRMVGGSCSSISNKVIVSIGRATSGRGTTGTSSARGTITVLSTLPYKLVSVDHSVRNLPRASLGLNVLGARRDRVSTRFYVEDDMLLGGRRLGDHLTLVVETVNNGMVSFNSCPT